MKYYLRVNADGALPSVRKRIPSDAKIVQKKNIACEYRDRFRFILVTPPQQAQQAVVTAEGVPKVDARLPKQEIPGEAASSRMRRGSSPDISGNNYG
jgi:hypothetical protein